MLGHPFDHICILACDADKNISFEVEKQEVSKVILDKADLKLVIVGCDTKSGIKTDSTYLCWLWKMLMCNSLVGITSHAVHGQLLICP